MLTVTSPSDVAKGSTITVTMPNNVMNPQTGAPSAIFSIYTFSNTASIDNSTSLTVTCDTPNLIVNPTSVRVLTSVNDITTFTVSFQTTNPIPAGSLVYFSMPKDQAVLTSSSATTISASYV